MRAWRTPSSLTVMMSYKRKLTVFRLGLFMCLAWAFFTATNFDLLGSALAVWNGNPTKLEIAQARASFQRKQDACQRNAARLPRQEFSTSCLSEERPMVGMPRDDALRNLWWFSASLMVLVIGIVIVTRMGVRMAKEEDTSSTKIPTPP